MQSPAEIGRELLRLRTRQKHAEIQCVQEMALGNPFPLLYQFPMHDRDLARRSAETDESQLEPIQNSFTEGWHRSVHYTENRWVELEQSCLSLHGLFVI